MGVSLQSSLRVQAYCRTYQEPVVRFYETTDICTTSPSKANVFSRVIKRKPLFDVANCVNRVRWATRTRNWSVDGRWDRMVQVDIYMAMDFHPGQRFFILPHAKY